MNLLSAKYEPRCKAYHRICEFGPIRFVEEGIGARPPEDGDAAKTFIIFVRDDGWSIGTTKDSRFSVFQLWPHEWRWAILWGEEGMPLLTIEEFKNRYMKPGFAPPITGPSTDTWD